ncbi:MAG: M15 family metallopeptidase, partial [Bacilli bacterium]|nr:M15 family metallopeptidase [Bacilli bacterium]
MTKIKVKKPIKISFVFLVLLIVLLIFGNKFYKEHLYKQTYEYKLLEINYSLEETKPLIKYLNQKEIEYILTKEYNSNIVKLVQDKYFIFNNLERYIKYTDKNNDKDIALIIKSVNVNRDLDFYENPTKTNLEDKHLMLVNKYYFLEENYIPENLNTVSLSYSYEGNSINEEVINAFMELSSDAKNSGYTIVINSSYRDYNSQKEVWESRKVLYGTRKADSFAARAGHSEHQTGFAIDVADFFDEEDTFGNTDSFIWMKENCYKHGFILRYPADKEDITGYSYEPWHYRYVGKEVANIIKK